jgi:dTDP-4-dehydrorhamnose reductase
MLGHKLYQTMAEPLNAWTSVRGNPRDLARYSFYCPDRVIGDIDVANECQVRRAMDIVRPNAVVNCVGLIKQHPAAQEPDACITINALLPHRLANICTEYSARFVHVSTDCVFDGTKGNYKETDLTNAEDLYGRTKALGETKASNAITLRTSIIGRELNSSFGLVDWFLAQKNAGVQGFTQAKFSGFTTRELSRVISKVLIEHADLTGLYQVSSEPIDKYSLLNLIRDSYGLKTPITPSDDLRIDRSLDSSLFRSVTGYRPPAWPEMIRKMCADPTPYDTWRDK